MKKIIFWAFVALMMVGCCKNGDKSSDTKSLRILSYNVGVFNKYLKDGYTDVANIIKETNADIVLFQELDSCTTRTGKVYQLEHICSMLDGEWDFKFGAGLLSYREGQYGVGIAAKQKAVEKFSKNLANYNDSERRGLAVLDMGDYVVASTHLGLKDEAQIKQLEEITTLLKGRYGNSGKPVFLGGDLNAAPDFALMPELKKDWTILTTTSTATYSTEADKYCIDYVLLLNNGAQVEVTSSAVVREAASADVRKASDHYPIYVDVKF